MSDFSSRFCAARRACIARDFAKLNPEQRRGVLTTEGPLLLLAGAGSGKTTVLINRIANLLTYGRGSDCGEVPAGASEDDLAFLENYPAQPTADERRRMRQLCAVEPPAPWQVLAVTFTNKAAKELRERLEAFGIAGAGDIWALTFHSACVRILRRDIDKRGFSNDFTIYDTDDCKRVVKDILKEMDLDEKTFSLREVLAVMAERGQADLLPRVFDAYRELLGDKLGICVVDVTTAVPLDDGLRQLITEKAEADLGRRAVLRERIDASILGGIIMDVDGNYIDASMISQLNRARNVLKDTTDGGEC